MPKAAVNGIDLHYEEAGPHDGPVILLVMGLGTQLIAWPVDFIAALAARGYRVISFDNRDIGLSTLFDGAPAPHPLVAIAARRFGWPVRLAYSLKDMAADAVGLLDSLDVPAAHVVGASMGGMIAQNVAALWPERVLSLTSIMSSSGAPGLPGPSPELRRRMLRRRPPRPSREEAIAAGAETLELIAFPDTARAPDAFRSMAARAFDRSYNPLGSRRQLLAILTDDGRPERLRDIRVPTLVIHGAADPLVPLANSEDIARRIPGARLEIIPHMAHDLPPSQVGRLAELITAHAAPHQWTVRIDAQ